MDDRRERAKHCRVSGLLEQAAGADAAGAAQLSRSVDMTSNVKSCEEIF
jgi:hypothetical protein